MSITVPAGSNQVKLRYRPWDVPLGFLLMLVGLIVAGYYLMRGGPRPLRPEGDMNTDVEQETAQPSQPSAAPPGFDIEGKVIDVSCQISHGALGFVPNAEPAGMTFSACADISSSISEFYLCRSGHVDIHTRVAVAGIACGAG
jgi:hypothetical protein